VNRRYEALLAGLGLALFAFVATRIGWGAVIGALKQSSTAVAVIIVLSLARLTLQTRSWSIALRADGIEISTGELIFARLASQGMGYLSVLGPVASEPMKISLLKKSGASATTATLVDSGVYWFSSGIVGIAGCLAAAFLSGYSRRFAVPLGIVAAMTAAALFLIARPKARFPSLLRALRNRCPGWLKKCERVEAAIREFQGRQPSAVRAMFWLDVACQLLLATEVVAVLYGLKLPVGVFTVLAVEGASRAIKIMTGWMPARIGADESGIAGTFFVLGLPPAAGLSLALARRSKDLLGAFIGLSWLAWRTRFRNRMTPAAIPKSVQR
jgi:hypothetical protein